MREIERVIGMIVIFTMYMMFCPVFSIAGLINLPQTGQVHCYNAAGAVIDCAGTGQDGDIRAGVPWPNPRFVDNLDGTITDKLTGLMWLQDADCFFAADYGRPWQVVLTTVADFNAYPGNYHCKDYTATYNDWRVPNILELESLPNEDVLSTTWLDSQGFKNVYANQYGGYFWSSTNLSWYGTDAWPSDMTWRRLLWQPGDTYINLWPVRLGQQGNPDPNYPANVWRTGQTVCFDASGNGTNCAGTGQDGDTLRGVAWPDPRFTDNGDGTITDNLTGLTWLKDMGCFLGSWQAALDAIAGFNSNPTNYNCHDYAATFNDWRLPNRKELLSLLDFSQSYPALPSDYSTVFEHKLGDYYWSSNSCTPSTFGANYAWVLGMYDGDFGPVAKTESNIAWPVRGGPTGSSNISDISVTKVDDPDPVQVGQQLTYTVTVANNGPDQGKGVTLTDNLPAGVTYVSANSDQGTCSQSNRVVTCNIGDIANGSHAAVTIKVLAPGQSGTLTNKASVSCTSVDLYPQNNNATIYTTVAGPVNLPQTGQTTSYYPRDDGDLREGVVWPNPRFTILYCDQHGPCPDQSSDCDNNASTDAVIDRLTGLMWSRDGNIAQLTDGSTWAGIIGYVQSFLFANGLCGSWDWRVPNINELLSLNISPSLNSEGFVNVRQDEYWSSTTLSSDTGRAFLGLGAFAYPWPKSDWSNHYLILVHGGTNPPGQVWRTGQTTSYAAGDDGSIKAGIPWPSPRFTNPDGTTPVTGNVVLDKLTGLMWTKDANLPNSDLTWQGGLDYIANMNAGAGYGGYTDWRLPNYIELRSLWDLSRDPALPSGHPFANLAVSYFSSSTPPPPNTSDEVFVVEFGGVATGIGTGGKADYRSVWPVRGGRVARNGRLVDLDGDGKTDITIYRASTGAWFIQPSDGTAVYGVGFGGDASDSPVPGDYDADGKTDIALYRKSTGAWFISPSSTGSSGIYGVGFGGDASDIPVPADYDGDGKTDLAIYRSSTGAWFIYPSSTGPSGIYGVGFGGDASDIPVPADYDGDGKTDLAIYRSSTGAWFIYPSSTGPSGIYGAGFGGDPSDIPVPGDYDGDGKADLAIYRSSTGAWFIYPSLAGSSGIYGVGFGGDPTDIPVPGDYDGDGKTDLAIYRPSVGAWFIYPSSTGPSGIYGVGFGGDPTDIPITTILPSTY